MKHLVAVALLCTAVGGVPSSQPGSSRGSSSVQPAGLLRQVRLQGCCTTTAALCLQAQLGDSIYAALERVAERVHVAAVDQF